MRSKIALLAILFGIALGLSACASRSQNFYFGDYSEAERLYSKGEFEKAIEKYKEYRDENPEGNLAVIARYYMAKSYQALGENDKATEHYSAIVKENPDLVWANFSETQLSEMKADKAS